MRTIGMLAGLVLAFAASAAPERGPDDPLLVDSKWTGKMTQKGKIEGTETPLALEAELTVAKRDGTKFEGELRVLSDVHAHGLARHHGANAGRLGDFDTTERLPPSPYFVESVEFQPNNGVC